MQISLLTVVTMILVLFSASAETSSLRGGSHRALEECVDALPAFSVYKGEKCDWITKDEKNVVKKCNKSSSLGVVFDLCPFTCAKVGLGPCATSRATSQDTCGKCSGCLKPSGDCNNDNYEQSSCEQIGLVWCGAPSDFPRDGPSASPTMGPSSKPSVSPSSQPNSTPSESPSNKSSDLPSDGPSASPSMGPSSKPSVSPSSQPNSASESPSESPSSKSSDSPSSNGDTIDSLRKIIADLEASSLATIKSLEESIETLEESIESLEESIVQKDSIIADLSLQIEIIGVPIDPTSQCNVEDGELAFDKCQCSEQTVIKNTACSKVPVDCVDGFERDTGLTCEKACDGQCCTETQACAFFTGFVHRDGSCAGFRACYTAGIDEVRGPSCTGNSACRAVKSTLVEASCNDPTNANQFVPSCKNAEVGLIEGSCNGSNISDCYDLIAISIVDGKIENYYAPQDPQDVCEEDCHSAYTTAGADKGGVPEIGRSECNDDEFAAYPNWCTRQTCRVECREEFPSCDGGRDDTRVVGEDGFCGYVEINGRCFAKYDEDC